MPLVTEILRDGETLEVRWDYYTLSCMYTAAVKEAAPFVEYQDGKTFGDLEEGKFVDFSMTPIYYLDWPVPLVKKGKQVLKREHVFKISSEREIVLKPGDILKAWRESSYDR